MPKEVNRGDTLAAEKSGFLAQYAPVSSWQC